jgi:hypothetical protein
MKNILIVLLCIFAQSELFSQALVSLDQNGVLKYTEDGLGNKVPDYSAVGYKNGEDSIPTIPVKATINALVGDNVANIQAAIDLVSAMPLDANGFRGAVLLKAGKYHVQDSIFIKSSGVVLRGEGNKTIIYATATTQFNVFIIGGTTHASATSASTKKIVGSYIPYGSLSFNVETGHTFVKGDDVFVQRKPNQLWLTLLGSDTLLNATNTADKNWTASEMSMNYIRKVVAVNGNIITIDAPIVDGIDLKYAQGNLMKFTWANKVQNVGIENMYFDSQYASVDDENHGWTAVNLENLQHAWVRNIEVHHFGYSAVNISDYASFVTVTDCKNFDPIAMTIGGRKYSFSVNGQRNLVKNCVTDKGRHDYVIGSGATPGPNVFFNCAATNQKADIGPHQKWATGVLFDQIISDGQQNVQNRVNAGSGHGWTGAQVMYWNCEALKFIVQSAPGSSNWAVGCKGNLTSTGDYLKNALYPGIFQFTNTAQTFSLFEQQLCERVGNCKLLTSTKDFAINGFNVFPNPTQKAFTVASPVGYDLRVLSLDGSLIYQENKVSLGNHKLDFPLQAGIYLLEFKTQQCTEYKRLLVEN